MNKHLRWLNANKLALILDKANSVLFRSQNTPITEPGGLEFGRRQMHQKKYVKFLGVLLDEHLTWKYHITILTGKLARVSDVFFLRYLLVINFLKSLCYAMFFPVLQYGIAIWDLPITYLSYLSVTSVYTSKKSNKSCDMQFYINSLKYIIQVSRAIKTI